MLYKKILLSISLFILFFISMKAPAIVMTFAASISVAYILQPIANYMSKISGFSFENSAIIIYTIFITILMGLLSLIIPKFLQQVYLIIVKIPEFHESFTKYALPQILEKLKLLGAEKYSQQLDLIGKNISSAMLSYVSGAANFIWQYTQSAINFVTMFLLFPIILFFFLKDWNQLTHNFKLFIKRIGFEAINDIWEEADDLIAGFIKSLLNVSLILCVIYTVGLSIIDFEFALIFGIISGFAVLIPFIGPFCALISCVMLSLLTVGIGPQQLWILLVFVFAQTLDSSYLTPKIVGDKIGLHPTAIIFSVFVGGKVLGIAGMLLAIPVAGMTKIIFKRFIFQY